MAKIKGFSVLSKTDHKGLWKYKHYWEQYRVEVKITPFKEAHEWILDTPLLKNLWDKINVDVPDSSLVEFKNVIFPHLPVKTLEGFKTFLRNRLTLTSFDNQLQNKGYIAHWQFEEEDLPMVLEAWGYYRDNYEEMGLPENGDGVE